MTKVHQTCFSSKPVRCQPHRRVPELPGGRSRQDTLEQVPTRMTTAGAVPTRKTDAVNQMPPLGNQVSQKNRILLWTLSSASAVAALSGCNKDTAREADGVPATQVCASTLNTSAAAALKRISGTDKFAELEGRSTADGASQKKFSLRSAVEGLHGTASERNQCTIYAAGDKSAHPLIEVDFEVATSHPDKRTSLQRDSPKTTVYSMGAYAATNANFGASLFFACPTEGPEGTKPYVKASMSSM